MTPVLEGERSYPVKAKRYTDAETGFQYLRARYYDPATGQFISRDPLVAMTGSAYGYVDGNPLNGIDPLGLTPLWQRATAALNGAVAALSGATAALSYVAGRKLASASLARLTKVGLRGTQYVADATSLVIGGGTTKYGDLAASPIQLISSTEGLSC